MSLPLYDLRQGEPEPALHELSFETVDDPALLLRAAGPDVCVPRAYTLFAAARSPEAAPLWVGGTRHQAIVDEHNHRAVVAGGTIYAVPGHRLGGGGLLVRDGSVFWRDDVLPGYFRSELHSGHGLPEAWSHGLLRENADIVRSAGPLAVATHANFVWGHFLLEMMPKLFLLAQLRRMGLTFQLAVTRRRPDWVDAAIALYFQPDELFWYDSDQELVEAPVVLVPSMLCGQDYHLHPAFNMVADDFAARALAGSEPTLPPVSKLFLSRRGHAEGKLALLANTDAVEREMAALGFVIVQPETLPVREQMALLTRAEFIAGEYGSALHGSLFAPRGAGVICLNRGNALQDRIAALRGQRLGVLEAVEGFRTRTSNPDDNSPLHIDLDLMQRFVSAFLAPVSASQPEPATAPASTVAVQPSPHGPPAGPTATALRIGEYMAQHVAAGRSRATQELSASAQVQRAAFLYAEPIDPMLAPFGPLFTAEEFSTYEAQPVQAACFENGAVLASDGLVLLASAVLRDSLHGVDALRQESAVATIGGDIVSLKRPVRVAAAALHERERPCFVGFSGNWRDYAHWMMECLPRLVAFQRLRQEIAGLKLVMPDLPPDAFQRRTLALLGIAEPDIAFVADDTALPCATLWVMGSVDVWRPPVLVREAAQRLSEAVPESREENEGSMPLRVYVRRAAATRRMAAFDALTPVLQRLGFFVVAEPPPLDEQIRLLRNARLVVGEHGAALANLMFAKPGCRVLELFDPAGAQPMYWTLASLCGLRFGYAVGTHDPQSGQEVPGGNATYRIAPEQLQRALEAFRVSAPGPAA